MVKFIKNNLFFSLLAILLVSCGDDYNESDAQPEEVIDLQVVPYKGSFVDGGYATTELTCWPTSEIEGQKKGYLSQNPAISWKNIPSATKSFAIIIDLANHPETTTVCELDENIGKGCVHWQVYNISPEKTFMPEIKRYPKDFFTEYESAVIAAGGPNTLVGPNWNVNSYRVDPDGSGPEETVDTKGKYYLGPCPDNTELHQYRITLYALNTMISDTEPSYTRASFEEAYASNIITHESLSFKVVGLDFILVSDDFSDGDVVSNPLFACTEEGLMVANGKNPSLRWANEPYTVHSYALFMQDNVSLAIARGQTQNLFASPDFYPTLAATGSFTINSPTLGDHLPICDNFRCRHWGMFNIQLNDQVNYIPVGGITPDMIGADGGAEPYKEGFISGANLYNFSMAADEQKVLFTKMATVTDAVQSITFAETLTSGAGYGYYGPCAPVGAGTRQYQFSLMALNEDFANLFWKRQDENTLLQNTPRAQSSSDITIVQDTLSQMSVENFRYYFRALTNLVDNGATDGSPRWEADVLDKGTFADGAGGKYVNFFVKPTLGMDKTEFFRTTFSIVNSAGEDAFAGGKPWTEVLTETFVISEANLQFFYKDVGCELCRFCTIGTLPAEPYVDLWQNFGIMTNAGSTSLPPYDPQLPDKVSATWIYNNGDSGVDPVAKMNVVPRAKGPLEKSR